MDQLITSPAIQPGGMVVRVIIMRMFNPDAQRVKFAVSAGATIADILVLARPHVPDNAHERVRVALVSILDTWIVERGKWHVVRPHAGVNVLVRIAPGGQAALSVVQLLATVAAKALAGPIGQAHTFSGPSA